MTLSLTVSEILGRKRVNPPLVFNSPKRGNLLEFKCQTYHDETRSVELHFSEDRMILRLIAFPQ